MDTLEKMSQFIPRAAPAALREKHSVNADGPSLGQPGFTHVKTAAPNVLLKHGSILKVELNVGWKLSRKWKNNSPVLELPSLFPLGLAVDTVG